MKAFLPILLRKIVLIVVVLGIALAYFSCTKLEAQANSLDNLLTSKGEKDSIPSEKLEKAAQHVKIENRAGANARALTTLEVTIVDKENENKKIDAAIQLYKKNGAQEQELVSSSTWSGRIIFYSLEPGEYRVVGGKSNTTGYFPDRIDLSNSSSVNITIDENGGKLTLKYIAGVGSVRIKNVDQKDATLFLPDATFKLINRSNGEIVAENLVTDQDGNAYVRNIKVGNYAFIQTKSAPGYLLDETPLNVNLTDILVKDPADPKEAIINPMNSVVKRSVRLPSIKVNIVAKENLNKKVDAKVAIYKDGENTMLALHETVDGTTTFKNLEPGKYKIVGAMALTQGYLTDMLDASNPYFTFVTIGEKAEEVTLRYVEGIGSVKLTNWDEESKRLPGVTYQLINNSNGNLVVDNLVSDAKGEIYVHNLKAGKYAFVQTKALEGYVLDSTPVNVEVNNFVVKDPADSSEPIISVVNSGRKTNLKIRCKVTVEFLNEKNVLIPNYTTVVKGVYGETIELTKNQLVNDRIKEIELDGYSVEDPLPSVSNVLLNREEITVQYRIKGLLGLVSVPQMIDFGEITHDGSKKRVENPEITGKLIVSDKRATKNKGWALYCKINKELTNDTDSKAKIRNVLKFFKSGKEYDLSNSAIEVYKDVSGIDGKVDITSSWGNATGKDGFKFNYDGQGSPKTGSYSGEITWQVIAGAP